MQSIVQLYNCCDVDRSMCLLDVDAIAGRVCHPVVLDTGRAVFEKSVVSRVLSF